MQLIKNIALTIFIVFTYICIFVPQSFALTKNYLVTEATTFAPASPPGANVVVFRKNIFIENNTGGRFVISSTPDGTGGVQIGDELIVSNITAFKSYSYIATTNCVTFNSNLPPTDITHISHLGPVNFTFVIRDRCNRYQEVGPIYLVHLDIPGVEPFLELPWNYAEKGLSFTEAALAMSAYFDHEYPLLSSGLNEANESLNQIVLYTNEKSTRKDYSSHDGYDWAKTARAELNDPVLAAGSGDAMYVNSCTACGNMVVIDHKNGYQTRYMHMQKEGLISDIPNTVVNVVTGQPIGKVGATGNVIPAGDKGAHIHFMVVNDKNNDGNFNDNIPDGVVDPFGWQSNNPDPWANYTFNYQGEQKTGAKSYYAWTKTLDKLETPVNRSGGTFSTGKYTISFPPDSIIRDATLKIQPLPRVQIGNSGESLGIALLAQVVQSSGTLIKFFSPPFSLIIDLSGFDLDRFVADSIAIYSSEDGENWTQENTIIDWENKKATAQINHMTQFAVIGEKKDIMPPKTAATLAGNGSHNIFNTSVVVSLEGTDTISGVDYVIYRKDDSDWEQYVEPILFETEGTHAVEFYAEDNDGNIEEVKRIEFTIEKVLPELQISCNFDQNKIEIFPKDKHQSLSMRTITLGEQREQITVQNLAGKSLVMTGIFNEENNWQAFWIESLQYDGEQIIPFRNTRLRCLDNHSGLKTIQQYFEKGLKINLMYNQMQNSTNVTIDNEVTTTSGVKVLHLITEKGNLMYSY